MGVEKQKLQSFAVIEMMGHRKIVGLVTESDISGGQLLRVDVLNADGEAERTEYIGVGSIYCLTIVSEEAAKAVAARNAPRPAWAWNLPQRAQLQSGEESARDAELIIQSEREAESDWDDDDDNPY